MLTQNSAQEIGRYGFTHWTDQPVTPDEHNIHYVPQTIADGWEAYCSCGEWRGFASFREFEQRAKLCAALKAVHEEHIAAAAKRKGGMRTTDPMERIIEGALLAAGIEYRTDMGGDNPSGLDFLLPKEGVEIEVKQFHTPRIAEQMGRADNVIVIQGERAVRFFAHLLKARQA